MKRPSEHAYLEKEGVSEGEREEEREREGEREEKSGQAGENTRVRACTHIPSDVEQRAGAESRRKEQAQRAGVERGEESETDLDQAAASNPDTTSTPCT